MVLLLTPTFSIQVSFIVTPILAVVQNLVLMLLAQPVLVLIKMVMVHMSQVQLEALPGALQKLLTCSE